MHSFLGCLCSLVVCAEVGRDPNFAEHGHPGLQNLIWSLPGPQTSSTSVDDTSDVLDSIPHTPLSRISEMVFLELGKNTIGDVQKMTQY